MLGVDESTPEAGPLVGAQVNNTCTGRTVGVGDVSGVVVGNMSVVTVGVVVRVVSGVVDVIGVCAGVSVCGGVGIVDIVGVANTTIVAMLTVIAIIIGRVGFQIYSVVVLSPGSLDFPWAFGLAMQASS